MYKYTFITYIQCGHTVFSDNDCSNPPFENTKCLALNIIRVNIDNEDLRTIRICGDCLEELIDSLHSSLGSLPKDTPTPINTPVNTDDEFVDTEEDTPPTPRYPNGGGGGKSRSGQRLVVENRHQGRIVGSKDVTPDPEEEEVEIKREPMTPPAVDYSLPTQNHVDDVPVKKEEKEDDEESLSDWAPPTPPKYGIGRGKGLPPPGVYHDSDDEEEEEDDKDDVKQDEEPTGWRDSSGHPLYGGLSLPTPAPLITSGNEDEDEDEEVEEDQEDDAAIEDEFENVDQYGVDEPQQQKMEPMIAMLARLPPGAELTPEQELVYWRLKEYAKMRKVFRRERFLRKIGKLQAEKWKNLDRLKRLGSEMEDEERVSKKIKLEDNGF